MVTKVLLKSCARRNVRTVGPEVSLNYVVFSCLTTLVYRVPVQNIHVDTMTATSPISTMQPTSTPLPKAPHFAAKARAVIGGIVGLLPVVGAIAFMLWRRRRRYIRQVSAPSSIAMRSASGIGLTPFVLTHLGQNDQVSWMGLQRQQFGSPDAVGANADPDGPSLSTHSVTYSSSFPSVPVGLSAKVLAHMRAETSRLRPLPCPPALDVSGSQSLRLSVPAIEQAATASPSMFQTIQAQFDRLRRKMQQLRAEIFNSEAPCRDSLLFSSGQRRGT